MVRRLCDGGQLDPDVLLPTDSRRRDGPVRSTRVTSGARVLPVSAGRQRRAEDREEVAWCAMQGPPTAFSSSKGGSGSLRACRVLSVAGYYRSGVSALLRPGGRRAGLPSGSEETTRGVGIMCRSLDACCCTQVCASRRLTPRRPPRSSSDILLQRSVRFLCIILL